MDERLRGLERALQKDPDNNGLKRQWLATKARIDGSCPLCGSQDFELLTRHCLKEGPKESILVCSCQKADRIKDIRKLFKDGCKNPATKAASRK